VAFRMEAKPVWMCNTAQPNRAKGMAELMMPASMMGRQCWRNAG